MFSIIVAVLFVIKNCVLFHKFMKQNINLIKDNGSNFVSTVSNSFEIHSLYMSRLTTLSYVVVKPRTATSYCLPRGCSGKVVLFFTEILFLMLLEVFV